MAEENATRRKKLRLLAARRGVLEVELALAPFMSQELEALDSAGLDGLEALLALEDMDLWEVLIGRRPAPEGIGQGLVERIRACLPGREKSAN